MRAVLISADSAVRLWDGEPTTDRIEFPILSRSVRPFEPLQYKRRVYVRDGHPSAAGYVVYIEQV